MRPAACANAPAALPRPAPADRTAVASTYLLGTGEVGDPAALGGLRAGTRLRLRRARAIAGRGRPRVEVRSLDDRPLGYLPPEDAQLVADLLDAGGAASAHVTGLVPALMRSRVLLDIQVEAA